MRRLSLSGSVLESFLRLSLKARFASFSTLMEVSCGYLLCVSMCIIAESTFGAG